ncbi:eCIS core domain-containing protein [Nostoc sp.]|uniref:eCIS core domain-containing protein n=1 Tax=Nostoc sp. TaxID=1180 RepID=UPI002FFB3024
MQEPKQDKNANTKTDRQQTAVKNLSRNGQGIAASPLDPLVQQVSRMGNAPNPSAHAAILNRAPANQQSSNRQLLLQLQQQYGNPYVNQVLQLARGMGGQTAANTTEKPLMQAKLTIGSVGDKYEQEADRTAQQVVQRMNAPSQSDRSQAIGREAMPEAELQKKPEISTIQRQEMPKEKEEEQQAEVKQETDSLQLQKKCGGCEKKQEDNLAQMKPETGTFPQEELPKDEEKEELTMQPLVEHQPAERGMAATPKLETSIQQKRGKGQPLSDKLREPMEQAFGKDFSGVRVHADAQSDQINRSIQARAFTTGQDIFFRQGEYASGSKQGQELLAHELTHVVQQNGSAIKAKTEEGVTLSELSPDARVQRLCSNCEKEEKAENTLQAKEISSGTLAVAPEPEVSISQVTQPAIQRVFDDLPDRREPKAPKQEKDKQPEAPEETAESDTSDCNQQGDANKAQPEAQQEEQQPEKCPSEKEDKGKKQPKPEKTKPLKDKLSEKPASCVRQEQNPILQAFAPIPTATPNLTARSAITTATNTSTPQQNLQATGETASPETATEKVQATTTATEAQGQLRTTDAEVARLASSKINFKLPKQEETDTDNNSAALEEQRAAASSMASNFFAEAALRIQTVTGLGQSISARINGVAENAKASLMSTVQQQQDAVAAQINQQRTQVNSQAQRSIAEIQQQYQATLRNISLRTAEVSQRIQTEYSNAFQKVDQGETNLLSRVDQLYIQTYDQYIAAGDTVGNEATAVGEKWAKQWESEITHKYNNEDAVVEDRGHMRSTPPNAGKTVEVVKNGKVGKKASTAREVAKQYKEQVTEEATKQANNLVKGKAKDIKGICCGIKEFRKQLQKQQEETLKAVIDLQQDAVLQVTEAQTKLTESANQTLQGTLQSLDEQETAQLQILQGYGDRQVLAIERDAQKAIASLQKGVNQAANKLLTALQDYYSEFQGMEAPNPDELSVTLAEILGQFDSSIATVQKETEKGIAVSEDGIAQGEQQAVSAVGAIAQTVMEESAAVVEEVKTSFNNLDRGITNTFNQLRDAYTQAANKFVEATAKGLAQITQNSQNPLEQIYQKLSEALQKSVTQIETGLRDTLKCLETDIQNYAAKAVEDEPWWKSLLKALVFIVVIVVAIVLAPIGIGFVAGALGGGIAATIFASVVVGAALGAGLGALSQIANNAIDGKNLMDGVGKAALAGAIGGAIGGFGGVLGGALGNVGKLGVGLSKTWSKFGIETVFDTLGNIFGDLAAGNPITLEGVLIGAAIGAGSYVATTKGTLRRLGKPGEKIQSFPERSSEAGMRGGAFVGGKVKTAFGGKADTSVDSRSGVDGRSAKPSETEVKTPKTSMPGGRGVDSPTVSRPDVDVTGVKSLKTEVKAPATEKIPETVTSGERSTHYDEPEIEPGVVAKEKTADGHEIKVLKDGRIFRCTTCAEIKVQYKDVLEQNPYLKQRLDKIDNIEKSVEQAKELKELEKELSQQQKIKQSSNDNDTRQVDEPGSSSGSQSKEQQETPPQEEAMQADKPTLKLTGKKRAKELGYRDAEEGYYWNLKNEELSYKRKSKNSPIRDYNKETHQFFDVDSTNQSQSSKKGKPESEAGYEGDTEQTTSKSAQKKQKKDPNQKLEDYHYQERREDAGVGTKVNFLTHRNFRTERRLRRKGHFTEMNLYTVTYRLKNGKRIRVVTVSNPTTALLPKDHETMDPTLRASLTIHGHSEASHSRFEAENPEFQQSNEAKRLKEATTREQCGLDTAGGKGCRNTFPSQADEHVFGFPYSGTEDHIQLESTLKKVLENIKKGNRATKNLTEEEKKDYSNAKKSAKTARQDSAEQNKALREAIDKLGKEDSDYPSYSSDEDDIYITPLVRRALGKDLIKLGKANIVDIAPEKTLSAKDKDNEVKRYDNKIKREAAKKEQEGKTTLSASEEQSSLSHNINVNSEPIYYERRVTINGTEYVRGEASGENNLCLLDSLSQLLNSRPNNDPVGINQLNTFFVDAQLIQPGEMIDFYNNNVTETIAAQYNVRLQVHQITPNRQIDHDPIGQPGNPVLHIMHQGNHFSPLWIVNEDP